MLSSNFREAITLQDTGNLEIDLPDDDPVALSLLLNIIHSRSKRVPCQIEMDDLCRVAVLIDKYEMHEAISLHTRLWIRPLVSEEWPENFDRDMRQWLYISRVPRRRNVFKAATKCAVWDTNGHVD